MGGEGLLGALSQWLMGVGGSCRIDPQLPPPSPTGSGPAGYCPWDFFVY